MLVAGPILDDLLTSRLESSNLHSSLPIVRLHDIPGPFRRPATTLGCLASTLGLLHMGLIGPERPPQVFSAYATLVQLYDHVETSGMETCFGCIRQIPK